jgi:uncharacterized integral membrane protein
MTSSSPPAPSPAVHQGMFGEFTITERDQREVLTYRLALSAVALGELALLVQWYRWGPALAWPWLLLMAAGLGLALLRIHIYLRPLHLALKAFWLLGCLGGLLLAFRVGPDQMLPVLARQPLWILAVGPFFAALAGVGFKEFFCFQRPEAIGVTLLLPLALLGRLAGVLGPELTMALLALQAGLLLLLCLRKFPMPTAADVGDKSVFEHLERQRRGEPQPVVPVS